MTRAQIRVAIERQLDERFEADPGAIAIELNKNPYLTAFYLRSYTIALNELKDAKRNLDQVNSKAWQVACFLERLTDQIGLLRSELKKHDPLSNEYVCYILNREIDGLESEMNDSQKEADELEDQIAKLKQKYENWFNSTADLAELCLEKKYMSDMQFENGTRFLG